MSESSVARYVLRQLPQHPTSLFGEFEKTVRASRGDVADCAPLLQLAATEVAARTALESGTEVAWPRLIAAARTFLFAQLAIAATVGVRRLVEDKKHVVFFDEPDLLYLVALDIAAGFCSSAAITYGRFVIRNSLLDRSFRRPIPFVDLAGQLIDALDGDAPLPMDYDEKTRKALMERDIRSKGGLKFLQLPLYLLPVELMAASGAHQNGRVGDLSIDSQLLGVSAESCAAVVEFVSMHTSLVAGFLSEIGGGE